MAIITIVGVTAGSKSYTVNIILTEDGIEDGRPVVSVLGEAFPEIPEGTEPADVKAMIIDAARAIFKRYRDAVDKTADLREIDFPPIE